MINLDERKEFDNSFQSEYMKNQKNQKIAIFKYDTKLQVVQANIEYELLMGQVQSELKKYKYKENNFKILNTISQFIFTNVKELTDQYSLELEIIGYKKKIYGVIYKISQNNANIDNLYETIQNLKNEAKYKENILATVSHDFKTPLNGILSILEYILRFEQISEQTSYYLSIIKKNSDILLLMLSDMIDYSRIQNNKLRLCQSYFKIEDIIQETIELFDLQAKQKNLEIKKNIYQFSEEIYSDPNRIKQILFNLMSNAMKFTSKGHIMIIVQPDAINTIKISVEDTGVGIPEEIQNKLFQMYATFDHHNGSNQNGTGLGLMICQKIAGLLGPYQKIECVSQVNKGSCFSFLINSKSQTIERNRYISVINRNSSENRGRNQTFTKLSLDGQQQILIYDRKNSYSINRFSKYRDSNKERYSALSPLNALSPSHNDSQSINVEDDFGLMQKNISQYKQKYQQLAGRNIILEKDEFKSDSDLEDIEEEKQEYILFVDDQPFNVMAFKLMMQRNPKFIIDEAFNGQEALEKVYQFILINNQLQLIYNQYIYYNNYNYKQYISQIYISYNLLLIKLD